MAMGGCKGKHCYTCGRCKKSAIASIGNKLGWIDGSSKSINTLECTRLGENSGEIILVTVCWKGYSAPILEHILAHAIANNCIGWC